MKQQIQDTFVKTSFCSPGFKDLTRRTTFNKVLRDKPFNIAKNPKYVGFQRCLLSWFINFNKTSPGGAITRDRLKTLGTQDKSAMKSEIMPGQ